MKEKKVTLEAVGEFPFVFYIEKAEAIDEKSELILEGIASTTNIDHDKERMSKDALRAMEAEINKNGVPLRVEHQKDGEAIIGKVFKAWVDERGQLYVRARLDKSHPVSPILHHSMKNGVKMGLSVGGIVKRAVKEFSESAGGLIKTFYDVMLQEVSVTPRPANYDSWLVAKSIAKDKVEAENYSENEALRREFLFENSQLDYLQAFAKSIPDKAWHKVESPEISKEINNKNMENEDKKDETKDTEKAVSRAEFNSLAKGFKDLVKAVTNGFTTLGKAMEGSSAKETTNPTKEKADEAEQQTAKMDSDAMDTNNPDKKKPEDESPAAKTADDEKKEEAEKTADDKKDETEKAENKDDTYDVETVNRAIKSIEKLAKRIDDMKKADDKEEADETKKAEDKEEETEKAEDDKEETEKSAVHPLDLFVVTMTKAMESVVDRMEKSGKRILGFEKEFVEKTVKNNPEMQKELMALLKMPGFKKSVSMGIPFMVTKDGKRYPLMNTPEKVQKSQDEAPKSFKELYKTEYSSVSNETNE